MFCELSMFGALCWQPQVGVFSSSSISSSEIWTPVEIKHQPSAQFPRDRKKEKEYSAETKSLNLSAG